MVLVDLVKRTNHINMQVADKPGLQYIIHDLINLESGLRTSFIVLNFLKFNPIKWSICCPFA